MPTQMMNEEKRSMLNLFEWFAKDESSTEEWAKQFIYGCLKQAERKTNPVIDDQEPYGWAVLLDILENYYQYFLKHPTKY